MRTEAYPSELSRAEISRRIGEEPSTVVEYFGRTPFPLDRPETRPATEVREEIIENLQLIEGGIIRRLEGDGLVRHVAEADYGGCTTLQELGETMHRAARDFVTEDLAALSERGYKAAIWYANEVLWVLERDGSSEEKTLDAKFDATLQIACRAYRYGLGNMLGEARHRGFTDPAAFMQAAERSEPVFTFIAGHEPKAARRLFERLRVEPVIALDAAGSEPRFTMPEAHGARGACPALWSEDLIPGLYRAYLRQAETAGIIRRELSRGQS